MYDVNTIDDSPVKFSRCCCRVCIHFDGIEKGTCPAYPNGIPDRFSLEAHKHYKIEEDQIGDFIYTF